MRTLSKQFGLVVFVVQFEPGGTFDVLKFVESVVGEERQRVLTLTLRRRYIDIRSGCGCASRPTILEAPLAVYDDSSSKNPLPAVWHIKIMEITFGPQSHFKLLTAADAQLGRLRESLAVH